MGHSFSCFMLFSIQIWTSVTHILESALTGIAMPVASEVIWRLWANKSLEFTKKYHGPLTRYVKLRVAHAPGMPGTFSPPLWVRDPDMHHGTCVTDVPWCMPESLTSGFLWSRWRGKRSRHSRRMHNPQFCLSDKRPIRTKPEQIKTLQCSYSMGCSVNTVTNPSHCRCSEFAGDIRLSWRHSILFIYDDILLRICYIMVAVYDVKWFVATQMTEILVPSGCDLINASHITATFVHPIQSIAQSKNINT